MSRTTQEPQILSTLGQQHVGKWVALSQDEKTILCFAGTFEEVMEKVHKQGYPLPPLVVRIPDTATATFFF